MQKEAASSKAGQGANPPLPLLVNTHSTRPGPALSSTSVSSPALSIFLYHRTYRSATSYYYVRTRTVRHLCLATFVRTPRSAHGTGAVRYGTVRYGASRVQQSSPVSTRAAFSIPSIGIDPVPHAVS